MNKTKCIITSASSKFFPSLLNLLGSIESNYPNHPDVYVYDLGLFYTFRKELESIPWVHVLDIPHFVPHWRACYTWKTYILNTSLTENNLYIDAGCQILRPLDELFKKIDDQGYLAVSQGDTIKIKDITPEEYIKKYNLSEKQINKNIITAGIFGFKKEDINIKNITDNLYKAGLDGLCLGFSPTELWKNKGVNKTNFIRNCKMFRHDTTLITILLYKNIENPEIEPLYLFSSNKEKDEDQYIWNFRLNYRKLDFIKKINNKINIYIIFNRIYIKIFIILKIISNTIKNKLKKWR